MTSFPCRHAGCIIAGASRGLGHEIAKQFSHLAVDRMDLILSARTESDLMDLKQEIEHEVPKSRVWLVSGSLNDKDTLTRIEEQMRVLAGESLIEQVILIHNAGSLGDPSRLVVDHNIQSFDDLNEYFGMNVTSLVCLTSSFLTVFANVSNKIIVNISSLLAVQAMKGLSMYSCGKAARDAVIRSVALENPDVRCINYAPGPLETRMADELRADSYVTDFFENRSNLLRPETTVNKLISLLRKNEYENGSHVDVFDL